MRSTCQSRILVGSFCWLALVSCKDDPTDVIENVGGSAGSAGSGGVTSQGGSAGAGGSAGTAGAGGSPSVPGENLFTNPSFEAAAQGWTCIGNCTTSIVNDVAHTGTSSLFVANRTQRWEGAGANIKELVDPGTTYEVKAWLLRGPGDAGLPSDQSAKITLKRTCTTDASTTYVVIVTGTLQADWVQLSGRFEAPECELTELLVYFDDLPLGADYYVDDVSLTAMP